MIRIVGIAFNGGGKVYSFDARELDLAVGDPVIVETEKGIDFARVAEAVKEQNDDGGRELRAVVRKATDKDIERVEKNEASKHGAIRAATEKIEKHNLPMKLVDAEFSFDGSKVTFYFTSETRVDFRDLVRDLAGYFHARIELRQIGIRDECKMLGGIGPCGRACCCSAFQREFPHVSVRMAKTQGLSLNPTKISGLCGRLMCCLQYENAHYAETARTMPKLGSDVYTPDGKGMAIAADMLKKTVRVRLTTKDGFEMRDYALADLKLTKRMMGGGQQDDDDREDAGDELPQE